MSRIFGCIHGDECAASGLVPLSNGCPDPRAWGQSATAAGRLARLARSPFKLLPWPDGTALNWQNHRSPGKD